MAPVKFDGVIEAIRYAPNGEVDVVRCYERRGPTFSDRVIINRKTLVERLKSGKKFVLGMPKPLLASTFQVGLPVKLAKSEGHEVLYTVHPDNHRDDLQGALLF